MHTRFNQALTQTGRAQLNRSKSAKHTDPFEEGPQNSAGVSSLSQEGWLMFAADYSQMRIEGLAHISKDENLIEAFTQDMDIHTKTAMDVSMYQKKKSPLRSKAGKAVNFGSSTESATTAFAKPGNYKKGSGRIYRALFPQLPGSERHTWKKPFKKRNKGYVTTLQAGGGICRN